MSTDPTQTDPVPAAAVPVAGELIGRYTRADLEAMQGKRGRKPVEYYQVFPRAEGDAAPAASGGGAKPKATRRSKAPVLPAVSSAVIGDHTIDELLALIGSTGRKPVAYGILRQAAQVFADLGELTLPVAEEAAAPTVDPLAAQLAAASPLVRETVALLLASTAGVRVKRAYTKRAVVAAADAAAPSV